jgi:hypothetical protein
LFAGAKVKRSSQRAPQLEMEKLEKKDVKNKNRTKCGLAISGLRASSVLIKD